MSTRRKPTLSQSVISTILVTSVFACTVCADDPIDFSRDVRPILSDKCYLCHGPDDSGRQAELRLDIEDFAHEIAFVPESLDDSEAWNRINSDDEHEVMPPPDSHKELTQNEIATIGRWIKQGAKYQKHWSFRTIRDAEVPRVKNERFARSAIDSFIYQRQQISGLTPSEEAAREILIRRVTLDLIGLPPTIDEIEKFIGDPGADAYEKLVDRLLASPHYGERMAVDWLDLARYGDTSVFHADGPRQMWRWRDWVVHAFNENMPYDQFTIKQLAGDLIPNKTVEDEIASGFNRNNASTDEGGVIAEEYRIEYAVDRVKTTSMVWLGLSLECAQCHDHKYDPIKQEEYYRFFAFFNQASDPGMQSRSGNQEPIVEIRDDEKMAKVPAVEKKIAFVDERIAKLDSSHEAAFRQWLSHAYNAPAEIKAPQDMVAHFPFDTSQTNVIEEITKESAALVDEERFPPGKIGRALRTNDKAFVSSAETAAAFDRDDAFSYGCWVYLENNQYGAPIARMDEKNNYRGFDIYLLEGVFSAHLIHLWPSNAIMVTSQQKFKKKTWYHLFVTYDGSGTAEGMKLFVNGRNVPAKTEHAALTDTIKTDSPFTIGRRSPGAHFHGLVDDVRVFDRKLSDSEVGMLAGSIRMKELLAIDPYWRTDAQTAEIKSSYLFLNVPEFNALSKEKAQAEVELNKLMKPVTTVMVMQDVPEPRMTYVLNRGQYDSPNEDKPVQPGVPAILPEFSNQLPQNRLGLAQWLVSPENPLTARVTVNRFWKSFFGTGIVETMEDFGSQGQWPSHPDLLDWLANDFVQHDWDVKRLVKMIVMSEAYRQSSRVKSSQLDKDPENRLLSRGPRFRLSSEMIRDQALAVSGLLNASIGGPSVKPYQPPGLWNEVSLDGNLRFKQDTGEKLYRRSLYTYWKRSAPPPSMVIFDAPTREKCTIRRGLTNTPLQALVLMNDPQFVEASRMFAERILREGGESVDSKIRFAFETATARVPSDEIVDLLRGYFENEKQIFADDPERAKKILSVGERPRDESLSIEEHAAWLIIGNMILNLDEVITRG